MKNIKTTLLLLAASNLVLPNIASAGLGSLMKVVKVGSMVGRKPSRPELTSDEVLVPEKQYVVKMMRVKQLSDMEYAKSNKKIAGANKKIVVPYYSIKFPKKHRLEKSQYEKKGGVNIVTNIEGISELTYKTLTNWGYLDLLSKLQNSGFETIDYESVISNAMYQEMGSKKEKIKKGYSVYYPDDMKAGGEYSTAMNTPKLMDAFQADVLGINLILDPMARQRDQTKFVTKKTKVGQAVNVSYLNASINSMKGAKCNRGRCSSRANGWVKFINPIHSDIPFAHVEDQTNTKGNVAGHVLTGMMRANGKDVKTNYIFRYLLNADEDKYIAAAKDALGKTNDKLVSELNNIY